jgi:hypothetical protein
MRAWSWFLVTPLALLVAYYSAPTLKASLTTQEGAPTLVAPLNLPSIAELTAHNVPRAEREIHFAAFGIVTPIDAKTITRLRPPAAVFDLQSILMMGDSGTAVIDGDLVHPGDIIGAGYRVARIESGAVWLSDPRAKPAKRGEERYQVLRFPEYRDHAVVPQPVHGVVPRGSSRGQTPGQGGAEKDYRKILEMLKL